MKIRLGYACISDTINLTSSSTYTYTNFIKENDYEKLDRIIISNFLALEEILKYNIKNNIHFFRLSSNLIPLATKKEVPFDYIDKYRKYYNRISKLINNNNMRVDFHPSEFCVINSTRSEVIDSSIELLEYHYKLLEALHIKNKLLVLHIGSSAFGKNNSLKRFINVFNKLPKHLQEIIAVENDDKIFNIKDCLYLNKILDIPVILDYHHHICNYIDVDYRDIVNTWKVVPKMHFSSPKNKTKKEFRSHNDYIDVNSFINFIESIKYLECDIDIMIEAKKKDAAMFKLIRELKYLTNYKFIDDTTFIVK